MRLLDENDVRVKVQFASCYLQFLGVVVAMLCEAMGDCSPQEMWAVAGIRRQPSPF